jgi:hypothetical protein
MSDTEIDVLRLLLGEPGFFAQSPDACLAHL